METDAVEGDTGVRITTSPREGVLGPCVLALLARRDHDGLELADDLATRGLTASEGSHHPLLARLRDAGAVTTAGRTRLSASTRVWRQTSAQVDELSGDP